MNKEGLARRLDPTPPKKLLALDGGGIRGLITLEVLSRMERELAKAMKKGPEFRLCDFFDYIGGTSTGAIIAAGLARGMSVHELLAFYKEAGPAMFDKSFILNRGRHLYKSEPLAEQLQTVFGRTTTLEPEHLKCLLLVVTHNVTTDSPWPLSSNPNAIYNDLQRPDCNLRILLWQLVRASTAAPVFFQPEQIRWDPNNQAKWFMYQDGGMTPYNNPAFLLFRMATLAPYNLGWKTGERNMLLISIGTGAAPSADADVYSGGRFLATNAKAIPAALMFGSQVDQDVNCRTFGRCVYGSPIDREIGDLIPKNPLSKDLGRAFLYARYNVDLSPKSLQNLGLSGIDSEKVSQLDSVDALGDLSRVGKRLAEEVKIEHFGTFI